MYEFLLLLTLIWLIIASIRDLKIREIPNWLSFSLIISALAFRAFYSVINSVPQFFIQGIFGLAIFIILGYLFYYGRIFAGGDAKLLMALGPIIPLSNNFFYNLLLFGIFIFLVLMLGGLYGLIFSLILVIKKRKEFFKEFAIQLKKNKKLMIFFLFFAFLIFIFSLFISDIFLIITSLLFLIFPLLFIYSKAIEESCMVKEIKGKELRIGDWLYKEVEVGKRKIKPNWEGLNEKEIKLLRKKRKVKIKEGVPFVPAFLLAYIFFIILWYSSWIRWQILNLFFLLS